MMPPVLTVDDARNPKAYRGLHRDSRCR